MAQTIVKKYQAQWQKGQVATSHYVRDTTAISEDVNDIEFGELLIAGADKEDGARQPSPILPAVITKAYEIASGVVIITSAAHGLENGQGLVVANANNDPLLDGPHNITVLTDGTFSFLKAIGDSTGTLDYSVGAFTQKDIKGIVVKPVSGGQAKRFSDGVINYKLGDAMTLVEKADIVVELGANVEAQDDAYYVHTPGGASEQYTYRNDADTDKASQIPGKFLQGGSLGDFVRMRFNIDATLGS